MKSLINLMLSEGDKVELTYSPCPHPGFIGIVKLNSYSKEGKFSLFNGKSWLTNLDINTDEFKIIKKNDSGLFTVNNVSYYSKDSVLHNPKKCCKCGFTPVEYHLKGIFYNKYYCSNCL